MEDRVLITLWSRIDSTNAKGFEVSRQSRVHILGTGVETRYLYSPVHNCLKFSAVLLSRRSSDLDYMH